jgi:beta-phosphoglucomutase family hydrolase
MSSTGPIATLSPREHDAVLFDMDGVLTQTASIHAAAWKQLFDAFLERRSVATGEPSTPFDIDTDYRRYVDGKPRYDGVEAFLRSRGIDLPEGTNEDGPDVESVHGLGSRKDRYFMEHLERHGVRTFEAAVDLVRALRAQGVRTAVVTSSVNCESVLRQAGIADLFDVRVDGLDITRLGLRGKPAPDAFLEAARRMHIEPARSVVVEDAVAGIEAGRAGRFGLVIGVDHVGDSHLLREAGADVVVTTLAQVHVATEPPSAWSLVYQEFDPAREGIRESLCALGNGYFATRGAAAWADADAVHYPGTYLAGGYNRLRTEIQGRVVENEDLVNLPNWLSLTFRVEDGEWLDLRAVTIRSYRQELDLRRGLLCSAMDIEDAQGRRTALAERRFVSMSDMHLGALELAVRAENWSGRMTIRSAIDGRVVNAGAKLYREFNNRHLGSIDSDVIGEDGILLRVRTSQSDVRIAQAAVTRAYLDGQLIGAPRTISTERGYIAQQFTVELRQDETLKVEKLAFLYTSRDFAMSECGVAARKALSRAERFDVVLARHVYAWANLWRRFDIRLQPAGREFRLNLPMLLRLNMFHLLQAASLNSIGLDIGVPARGWTGEAYQGHVFWDELFIFPALNYRAPELTRSLLMYRYRRLNEARAAAARAGLRGAMFPWQSGSDGQEETQELNLNHRSQRWIPDNSFRQRHVGSAIAYNVWQYFQVTQDFEFLHFYGAELILDIAHFWSSTAIFNDERQRYEIRGVMGPDEFHEAYPDSESFGLDNNAYTNVMAVWVLSRALEVLQILSDLRRRELLERLAISATEIERWEDMSRRMFVPFHENGIVSQFEGYDTLREFDWEGYRLRYGNIQRLDLILEAENDTTNRYKLAKQADVLMLFYVFSAEELTGLFARLGYRLDPQAIPRNVAYYDARSSHGSTLSRVVHAWVMARSDRQRSLQYYAEALQSDVSDIQQGTTAEGIHLGAMAGTVDLILRVSTGIEATGDVLRLNPQLPSEIERLDMRIRYRGHSLDLQITRDRLTIHGRERGIASIKLGIRGEIYEFACGSTREFSLT